MKRIIKYYILTGLFVLIGVTEIFSQVYLSTNQNYIHTRAMTNESGSTYLDNIDYFDALGRLTQSVQARITPTGKDLVTLQQYDDYDRESNTWLPAVVNNNYGAYIIPSTLMILAKSTYSNDQKPYTLPMYEATPLNRIREQYGPGSDWHNNNKAVRSSYFPNISGVDTLNCINYTISESSSTDTLITINRVGNYSTNTLFVTRVADEDGNTSLEFKDKLGRVILSRQVLRSGSTKNLHDTYYIYDNIGNLRVVLPPLASDAMKTGSSWSNNSSDIIRNYAYLYKFDQRNRNISKRLPGANWIYYVYDNADHLIFSQDGNQRRKYPQEWSFSIPDALGRTVLTGVCQSIYVGGTSKSIAKGCLNGNIVRATFSTSGTYSGYNLTHDASSMTFLSSTVLTASYFDNYSFRSLSGFSNTALNYESSGLDAVFLKRYGDDTQASEYKHTGLPTGTAVSQIGGSSTMLYYVNYYDSKKRLVQSKATNHLGGIESDYIAYNFIGQPVKKRHVHTATSQPTQTEEYTYSYDNAGRLLTTSHKLNSGSVVTISENTYDELGRLLTNKKGGLSGTQLTYSYNVRSWTKSITGSLFSENLYYYETSGGNTPRYNGNISSISWTQSGDTRRYNYGYDGLSRLTSANYTGIGNEQYGTNYSYDKHGNILTLQRYGKTSESTYGLVNNLTMTYNGNQLAGVQEGTGPVAQYSYDANGNMTTDGRKNLQITYNLLNLQQSLSQNGTTVASYTWLADGTKCGVVDNNNNGYDYTGSLIYSRSGSVRTPESIDNGAGRIIYSGGTYNPHYYITDHLGSTRVITDNSGNVVERDDYYPFGGQLPISTYPQLSVNRFKFNGKELQTTGNTGFLDYGARMYDDVIGRWGVVDPMAEKYYSTSPYVFCDNNPVTNIDPNGMDWYSYEDEDGNVYYQYAEGDAGSIEVGGNTYDNIGSSVNIQFGGGMYFNAFQNYTVTSIDNPVDVKQMILNNPGLRGRLLASNSDFSKLGKAQIMESSVRKGQDDFLNNPVTKTAVDVLAMFFAGGITRSLATIAGRTTKVLSKELPTQIHHFATNKNSIWTDKMLNIAKLYGLDLNGAWNKAAMPHLGRHPNAYHNFVYQSMQRAALEAGGNQAKFLQLFNKYVKQPVLQNPELLRKSGW